MTSPETQARPPVPLTASEPFRSGHTRATVVVALCVAYIVVAASAIVANLMKLETASVVIAAEAGQEQFTLDDLLQLLVGLAALFVLVPLGIAFLVWLHRVAANIPALGNPKSKVEHTPGWAVGSFFVPFINLFIPYKAVKEVWAKSDPSIRTEDDFMYGGPSSSPLLLIWWLAWLASSFLGQLSWRLEDKATGDFIAGVEIVSGVAGILASVLAIMVVRDIDRRQAERARHVRYIPNLPPPPPLFRQPQAPLVGQS